MLYKEVRVCMQVMQLDTDYAVIHAFSNDRHNSKNPLLYLIKSKF